MEDAKCKKPLYKKWDPLPNIPSTLDIVCIHNDHNHFYVLLKTENSSSVLRIMFEFVLFYRGMDEGYLLRTWNNINKERNASLYVVEDSSLISWFHDESFHVGQDLNIRHYSILTDEDCIDILSSVEPVVEWLDK